MDEEARFAFTPAPGEVARVTLRWGALSALTFGAGRFWFKTAQRRLIWRRTTLAGDPFEYDGSAYELLRGTALAVFLLGLALVAYNLILALFGLAVWGTVSAPATALLNLLALLPLFEFAKWRARRYRLIRTKWRGLRFGMAPGAAGFLRVWLIQAALMALSFGLSRPWLRVARERYMTERMVWGDARFHFIGEARPLLHPWLRVWFAAAAAFGAIALIRTFALEVRTGGLTIDVASLLRPPLILLVLWLLLRIWLRYRAAELRLFMEGRRIEGVRIHCRLAPEALTAAAWRTIWRGALVGAIATLLILIAASAALQAAIAVEGGDPADYAFSLNISLLGRFQTFWGQAIFALAAWLNYGVSVLFLIWVFQAQWLPRAHGALMAATSATGLESLAHVRQRQEEDQIEADGFADALDAGGL